MVAASFPAGVRRERYSVQQETAPDLLKITIDNALIIKTNL